MTGGEAVRVPSLSKPGDSYVVRRDAAGVVTCSCPAFSYGKKKGLPCKHVMIWEKAEGLLARCVDQHGAYGTVRGVAGQRVLCEQCLVATLAVFTRRVVKAYVPRPVRKKKQKGETT